MLLRIIIDGLVFSGLFAVLAVGFSLIFGVAKILNMAHTVFYMLAAFIFYSGSVALGISPIISVILALLITPLMGIICYRLFFDRIKEHETAVIIVSIGLAMAFQEIFLIGFGGEYRGVKPFIDGYVEVGGVSILYQNILVIIISAISITGLWLLLLKTTLGKAIRAVAQDKEVANLMGISVSKIALIAMGISTLLAAIAGITIAPLFMVFPLMWVHPLVIVLSVVVLGGIESLKGAVIAAIILGFAEAIVISVVPGGSFLRGAVSLTVMLVVLMIRPEGLFGIVFEEERL